MRQTLYFALPDVPSAEQTIRDLLLAHIEIPRIHCVARRGSTLGKLPETNILQKADVMPVAGIGFAFGGMLGGIVGGLLVLFPPAGSHLYLWTMPFAAAIGAALGAGVSTMAGILAPNSRIAAFERSAGRGNILLMAEVPYTRSLEIVDLVRLRHPAALLSEAEPESVVSGLVRS
jgi:hypothetical protein